VRTTIGKLRRLLDEGAIARLVLLTEEDDSIAHEEGASGDSLDSQIDRYLNQYESDSKKADGDVSGMGGDVPSVDQMESLDWSDLVKGVVINEAGEADKDAEETPEEEAPGADAMTGEETDKLGIDKLDVEKFANDVVRLIDNYDSLLEVRSTLLRRASNFLKKNYSDDVLKAFTDTLRDDHGMEAGNDVGAINADKFPAPAADRANGSAAPGAGGGGAPGGV
jgi:hypothetical protein